MSVLTRRQQQVLVLASQGMPARRIAAELGISHHTAREHVLELRRRLGARTTHHAVAIAYQQGLLR